MRLPKNYYNYFDICKMEGIPDGTAKRATANGLKGIAAIEDLKPIGHLFKEFEKPVKGGMRKQYGILRRYYDHWKQTGEPPKVQTGRPPKGLTRIYGNVPVKLKEEFYAVVDKANSMSVKQVTYSDMLAVALREWIDRRPQLKD